MLTASVSVNPSFRQSQNPVGRIRLTPTEMRLEVSRLIAENQMVAADTLSRELLGNHPAEEEALVTRILVCEVLHRWQEAAAHLRQLLDLQGLRSPAETWYHYVRVLNCAGDSDAALQACQGALNLHPGHEGLGHELNRLLGLGAQQGPASQEQGV